MKSWILLFHLNIFTIIIFSQEFSREYGDFTIKYDDEKCFKLLSFSKHPDSSTYDYLKFDSYYHNYDDINNLTDQIPFIKKYWKIAEDSISINLTGMMIGYPLVYKDLLLEHINIFIDNEKWLNYYSDYKAKLKEEYIQLNYKLIKELMNQNNSYNLISPLLKELGYSITEISIEKVGFITDKDIEKYNLQNLYPKEKLSTVPVPFIVYLKIEKID